MKISYADAPVKNRAESELGADANTVYTYGDTVYLPVGTTLSAELAVHEATHSMQQGDDPAGWWERYFSDSAFRVEQEVEAYRKQFRFFSSLNHDRNAQARHALRLAGVFAGKLYGNAIDWQTAYKRIKGR